MDVRYEVVGDATGRPADHGCDHLDHVHGVAAPPHACEECVRDGTQWVHLRQCLECGHVGCCDSSPMRHATAHWHATTHPIVRSAEPGEEWAWCYPDELMLVPA